MDLSLSRSILEIPVSWNSSVQLWKTDCTAHYVIAASGLKWSFHSEISRCGRISIHGLALLEFEIVVDCRYEGINSGTGERLLVFMFIPAKDPVKSLMW
jgi:hypothetical protein